uniref:AA_permease domain-containing protein n=1 Tax=Macrostomum lignano TaxID=282301 RepID=A0A1I8F4K8_9PLAT
LTNESAAICVLFIVGCYGGEAGFAYLTANAAIGGSLVPRLTKPLDAARVLVCLSLLDQRLRFPPMAAAACRPWSCCRDRGMLDCRAALAAQAADGDRLDDWLVA